MHMTLPVTIVFQDMPPSPALRADIERHAEHLTRFAPRLLACHVTLRHSESRHHQGNRYLAHVRVTLPGGELAAGRTADPDHSHQDAYVAVRDAFDALRRQLEDFQRIRRGDVKSHPRKSAPS
jgi:ribosome-associated translation inhibitor RaiA